MPDLATSGTWWSRQLPIIGSAATGRILPVTWTLDVEMQFYLAAPFLFATWRRLPLRFACATICGAFAWAAWLIKQGIPVDAARLDANLGFFGLGFFLKTSNWRPSIRFSWAGLAVTILLFVLTVALPESRRWIWRDGQSDPVEFAHTLLAPWGLASLSAVASLPFLARNLQTSSSGRDRWLGQLAFPLFLFHWIPREYYYQTMDRDMPYWNIAGWWIVQLACSALGAIVLSRWIDQPSEALRRRVLGPGRLPIAKATDRQEVL